MNECVGYVMLGSAGSGRRAILGELAVALREEGRSVAFCMSAQEAGEPGSAQLAELGELVAWSLQPGGRQGPPVLGLERPDAQVLFIVADGRSDPLDFVEAAAAWIPAQAVELARVLAVVDCSLASANPPLMAWFEACVHFSDYVLLSRREGVPNKWISSFQAHFRELCYPCHFEFVKQGRLKNPAFVLLPEARRISPAFELHEQVPDIAIEVLEETEEGEVVAADPGSGEGDADEDPPMVEPLFERLSNGRRRRELPAIAQFLPAPGAPGIS